MSLAWKRDRRGGSSGLPLYLGTGRPRAMTQKSSLTRTIFQLSSSSLVCSCNVSSIKHSISTGQESENSCNLAQFILMQDAAGTQINVTKIHTVFIAFLSSEHKSSTVGVVWKVPAYVWRFRLSLFHRSLDETQIVVSRKLGKIIVHWKSDDLKTLKGVLGGERAALTCNSLS